MRPVEERVWSGEIECEPFNNPALDEGRRARSCAWSSETFGRRL